MEFSVQERDDIIRALQLQHDHLIFDKEYKARLAAIIARFRELNYA